MKQQILWLAIASLALSGTANAAEQSEESKPPDMEEMQQQMQQVRQQIDKQQQENLERLKQISPQAYESQKKAQDRQGQIGQILSDYQQKKISADDAERKLTPLIRQEVQQEMAGMDNQIKAAEKKLATLRQAKGNPNALVKKRVDQMLGRGGPPTPDEMIF